MEEGHGARTEMHLGTCGATIEPWVSTTRGGQAVGRKGQAMPCVFRGAPVEEAVEQGAGRKLSATVQSKEAQGQSRR